MVKKILLLGLLVAGLSANEMETVDLKVCIDTTKHADKSFNQMKEMLVSKAQDEGFNSFYKTAMGEENKNALTEHHRKDLVVKVNDMSDEGNNFCNNSTVSIKKDRLQYYLPQKVSQDRICHKDGTLSPTKLKEAAALKGYKALISEITDKEISDELAQKLVHNYQRDDGKMYMAQGAYCFGASGEVVPFEVDMGNTLSQLSKASNRKIKIIKNKGYAKVYCRNGKSFDFNVDFNGNGFKINPKDYKKMEMYLKNGVSFEGTITTQLMVPDEIKTNSVNVVLNGKPAYTYFNNEGMYNTSINGKKDKLDLLDPIAVKHNDGLRYVELTIGFEVLSTSRGRQDLPDMVKNFKKLSYTIEGIKANSFMFDQANFQQGHAKVNFTGGQSSEFNVGFNGNGFMIQPQDYEKMMTYLNNKKSLNGIITTQLIIPDEIKTNRVKVKINGKPAHTYFNYEGKYYTSINGKKDKLELLDGIAVKHNNGLRYIELTIGFEALATSRGRIDLPDIAKEISNISYMATDTENGEKWYALTPEKKKLIL